MILNKKWQNTKEIRTNTGENSHPFQGFSAFDSEQDTNPQGSRLLSDHTGAYQTMTVSY